MIRLFDIIFSFLSLILFFPLFILIFLVGFLDTGLPLFIQKRVGLNIKNFSLIKFRTMKIGALSVSTHLIDKSNITCFGYFLRKLKLDELPQLLNVLMGDMSLVGPRPCLPSQKRLIIERKKRGVYKVKPGITGLAQVSGINMSRPVQLTKTDLKMIKQMNLFYYFYYIFKTVLLIFKKGS
jgi:lipopolysaccharide/colanic/teichoic acid biosynthesis glycosyltransferase